MINCDVYDDDDIYDEVYGDDDNLEDVGLRSWTVAGVDPSGVDAQPPRAIQYQPTEQHKYGWKYKSMQLLLHMTIVFCEYIWRHPRTCCIIRENRIVAFILRCEHKI